ncbi:MAG: imidazoleglycerol-phosphate dehydratase, partial [Planctomycetes bacterium]|nr:imidazoleglycerol-phosphate dehydratase [Planctomycetota bacterium]
GQAFADALGEERRIRRFASAFAPLDDSLARAVVDISGRAYLHYGITVSRPLVGTFDTDLVREFFQSFVDNSRINLHLDLLHGQNAHHQIEATFKATALALRDAVARDSDLIDVPSTKGTLTEKAAKKKP